jgi:hypothetical protein
MGKKLRKTARHQSMKFLHVGRRQRCRCSRVELATGDNKLVPAERLNSMEIQNKTDGFPSPRFLVIICRRFAVSENPDLHEQTSGVFRSSRVWPPPLVPPHADELASWRQLFCGSPVPNRPIRWSVHSLYQAMSLLPTGKLLRFRFVSRSYQPGVSILASDAACRIWHPRWIPEWNPRKPLLQGMELCRQAPAGTKLHFSRFPFSGFASLATLVSPHPLT